MHPSPVTFDFSPEAHTAEIISSNLNDSDIEDEAADHLELDDQNEATQESEQDQLLISLKGSIASQSINKLLDDIETTPTGPKRLKKRKGCIYEKGQAMYKIKTFSSSSGSDS